MLSVVTIVFLVSFSVPMRLTPTIISLSRGHRRRLLPLKEGLWRGGGQGGWSGGTRRFRILTLRFGSLFIEFMSFSMVFQWSSLRQCICLTKNLLLLSCEFWNFLTSHYALFSCENHLPRPHLTLRDYLSFRPKESAFHSAVFHTSIMFPTNYF